MWNTIDLLESINTSLHLRWPRLKYQCKTKSSCFFKASIVFFFLSTNTSHQKVTETAWQRKTYKQISRVDINYCMRLHCLFPRRYKLQNWMEFNGIELQGQRPDFLIGWRERKSKEGGERGEDKEGDTHTYTEEQASHESTREWDLQQEVVNPLWFRGRDGEMSCRHLYKISFQVYWNTVGTSRRCRGTLELHVFLLANVMNNFCNLPKKCLKFYLCICLFVILD